MNQRMTIYIYIYNNLGFQVSNCIISKHLIYYIIIIYAFIIISVIVFIWFILIQKYIVGSGFWAVMYIVQSDQFLNKSIVKNYLDFRFTE